MNKHELIRQTRKVLAALVCLLMPVFSWADFSNTAYVTWQGGSGQSNTVTIAVTVSPPPTNIPTNVRVMNFEPVISLDSSLQFAADGPVDHYDVVFNPEGSGVRAPSFVSRIVARAGSTSYAASSTNGVLPLKSVNGLRSGAYRLSVTATNSAGTSAPAEADIQVVTNDLTNVRVYPNPWRADQHAGHSITFDSLTANSTVKLFTVSGHWVKTLDAPAGLVKWDLANDSGDKVASGLYLYLITNGQGQKAKGKVAVIR